MPRQKLTDEIVSQLKKELVELSVEIDDKNLVRRACNYLDRHTQTTWLKTWQYLDKHKHDSRTAHYAMTMHHKLLILMEAYRNGEIPPP